MRESLTRLRDPGELYGRPWEPQEYAIVLAAYFQGRDIAYSVESEVVRRLSALIGRTPASIVMRMENFASLDSSVARKGLVNVGPECRKVFEYWCRIPDHLASAAGFMEQELALPRQAHLFGESRLMLPKAFGQYELYDRIGRGSFGDVFSCIHRDTGKAFAIKIIRADLAANNEVLGRFGREIRALRSVGSPSVVRIYEDNLEEEAHFPAFIMELALESLSSFIVGRAARIEGAGHRPLIPMKVGIEIMMSIITGVEALHSSSPPVIHRDINPSNILLLPDGRRVLSDFGLAKFLGGGVSSTLSSLTQRGWGTLHFAAPEQREYFKYTDQRADIYSLGMLLWELFSVAWHPPKFDEPALPEPLKQVFVFASNPDYEARCPSIAEFRRVFEEAVRDLEDVSEYIE